MVVESQQQQQRQQVSATLGMPPPSPYTPSTANGGPGPQASTQYGAASNGVQYAPSSSLQQSSAPASNTQLVNWERIPGFAGSQELVGDGVSLREDTLHTNDLFIGQAVEFLKFRQGAYTNGQDDPSQLSAEWRGLLTKDPSTLTTLERQKIADEALSEISWMTNNSASAARAGYKLHYDNVPDSQKMATAFIASVYDHVPVSEHPWRAVWHNVTDPITVGGILLSPFTGGATAAGTTVLKSLATGRIISAAVAGMASNLAKQSLDTATFEVNGQTLSRQQETNWWEVGISGGATWLLGAATHKFGNVYQGFYKGLQADTSLVKQVARGDRLESLVKGGTLKAAWNIGKWSLFLPETLAWIGLKGAFGLAKRFTKPIGIVSAIGGAGVLADEFGGIKNPASDMTKMGFGLGLAGLDLALSGYSTIGNLRSDLTGVDLDVDLGGSSLNAYIQSWLSRTDEGYEELDRQSFTAAQMTTAYNEFKAFYTPEQLDQLIAQAPTEEFKAQLTGLKAALPQIDNGYNILLGELNTQQAILNNPTSTSRDKDKAQDAYSDALEKAYTYTNSLLVLQNSIGYMAQHSAQIIAEQTEAQTSNGIGAAWSKAQEDKERALYNRHQGEFSTAASGLGAVQLAETTADGTTADGTTADGTTADGTTPGGTTSSVMPWETGRRTRPQPQGTSNPTSSQDQDEDEDRGWFQRMQDTLEGDDGEINLDDAFSLLGDGWEDVQRTLGPSLRKYPWLGPAIPIVTALLLLRSGDSKGFGIMQGIRTLLRVGVALAVGFGLWKGMDSIARGPTPASDQNGQDVNRGSPLLGSRAERPALPKASDVFNNSHRQTSGNTPALHNAQSAVDHTGDVRMVSEVEFTGQSATNGVDHAPSFIQDGQHISGNVVELARVEMQPQDDADAAPITYLEATGRERAYSTPAPAAVMA